MSFKIGLNSRTSLQKTQTYDIGLAVQQCIAQFYDAQYYKKNDVARSVTSCRSMRCSPEGHKNRDSEEKSQEKRRQHKSVAMKGQQALTRHNTKPSK